MEDVEASEFPDKVRLVRYEDLSLDTLDTVRQEDPQLPQPALALLGPEVHRLPHKVCAKPFICPEPVHHSQELQSFRDVLGGENALQQYDTGSRLVFISHEGVRLQAFK